MSRAKQVQLISLTTIDYDKFTFIYNKTDYEMFNNWDRKKKFEERMKLLEIKTKFMTIKDIKL